MVMNTLASFNFDIVAATSGSTASDASLFRTSERIHKATGSVSTVSDVQMQRN